MPFSTIDIHDSCISPIYIPPTSILMRSNIVCTEREGGNPEQKKSSNTFYICRHKSSKERGQKNIQRLSGDFCLWSPNSESFLKWKEVLDDPIASRNLRSQKSKEVKMEIGIEGQVDVDTGEGAALARLQALEEAMARQEEEAEEIVADADKTTRIGLLG